MDHASSIRYASYSYRLLIIPSNDIKGLTYTNRGTDKMVDQMSTAGCFYFPEPLFTLTKPLKGCRPHRRKISAVAKKDSNLRVRVLTNSLQNQALADELRILYPHFQIPPPKIKPDLYLTPVELKVLKSAIELEMIWTNDPGCYDTVTIKVTITNHDCDYDNG